MYLSRSRSMKLVLAIAAVFALAMLAGCGEDKTSTSGGAGTSGGGGVNTDAASLGDVTLTVWDQEVRGGQNSAMVELNKQFHEKFPNITIKRVAKSFTDLQTTLKLAASGPNPPDVVEANNGYAAMGPLVKANLLLDLSDYSDAYGWADRYSTGILKMNQFSADAATFGSGNLYGVPMTGEVVGVYYNKDILSKLGLDVPATWEDFVAAVEKAKGAGETAVQFGNLDKWPGIHEFETIQLQNVDKDYARNFIFGDGTPSFEDEGNTAAATTLADWASKGYFTDGFAGLGYDPSWQDFGKGKGLFLITGSWLTSDLGKALGDKVGFFLVPPPEGGSLASLGGEGLPWAISSKTANADAAAAYVNFITSDEAMQVVTDNGNLSASKAPVTVPAGLDTEVYEAWKKANDEDAIVPYLDWATPTMYDTSTAEIQKLMGGQTSPADFVSAIQADYAKFHSGAR